MKIQCGAALLALTLYAAPSEAGLIHLYQFSSDASDSVGADYGTLVGGASIVGGELVLDGLDDYVDFATHIVPTSGSYTVAMFARETAPTGGYVELISQGGGNFYLGHDPGGTIRAGDTWINTGVPFPSDGQLHHYALTRDAGANATKLYIDGVLQATLASAIAMGTGGTETRFGRQYDGHAEYLYGALDDVAIYDNALSAGEVAALAAPVPEPSTLVLSLTGALGAVYAARLRRRS